MTNLQSESAPPVISPVPRVLDYAGQSTLPPGWEDADVFVLKADGFKAVKRKLTRDFVGGHILNLMLVGEFVDRRAIHDGSLPALVGVFIFLTGLTAWTQWRRWVQEREKWYSTRVLLASHGVRKSVPHEPAIELRRESIGLITESRNEMVVYGDNGRWIAIPKDVEDYEKLRRQLESWHQIKTAKPRRWYELSIQTLGWGCIVLALVSLITSNKWVAAGTAAVVSVLVTPGVISVFRNPRVARRLWWTALIISVVMLWVVAKAGLRFVQ